MQQVTIPKELEDAMKPEFELYKADGKSDQYVNIYHIKSSNIGALTTYLKSENQSHDVNLENIKEDNSFVFANSGSFLASKEEVGNKYKTSKVDEALKVFIMEKMWDGRYTHPVVENVSKQENTREDKRENSRGIKNN